MTEHHDFLNPTCSFTKLDIFLSRRGILEALTSQIGHFHGTLLDVGCGRMPYKPIILAPPTRVTKYIGLDIRDGRYAQLFGSPDLEWDGHTIPLEAASVDCAMSTEVYVQCSEPEIVMRETARVLKPGGMLVFTVPFFWPIHDPPHDYYRFTPFALDRHLRNAGFENIKLQAFGGWDASLAQMIGLWVRRRPMNRLSRAALSLIAVPLIRLLAKMDAPPTLQTFDNTITIMITAISGTATKRAE
jgi:SAM-dependent methyltransferase